MCADWLDERGGPGDAERAAFIRASADGRDTARAVELAQNAGRDGRFAGWAGLAGWTDRVLVQGEQVVPTPVTAHVPQRLRPAVAEFRAGFVSRLWGVDPAGFLPHAEAVVAACPGLEQVMLRGPVTVEWDGPEAALLSAAGEGGWHRRVELGHLARTLDDAPAGTNAVALAMSLWLGVEVIVG